jgi:hypothetical protein
LLNNISQHEENQFYADYALIYLLNACNACNDYFNTEYAYQKNINWDTLKEVAKENRVLIRVYDSMVEKNIFFPESYKKYISEERGRIDHAISFMVDVSAIYEKTTFKYLFIKNYQHFPDMGDDIDFFVEGFSNESDTPFLERFEALKCRNSILNIISGKTQYVSPESPLEMEFHHGRLGPLGEHTIFPKYLMKNRRELYIDGCLFWVPSPEDQFIIHILQRVYGRFFLRISEIVYAVSAIFDRNMDWQYIFKIAKRIGIYDGLSYYLSSVDSICYNVMGKNLPLNEIGILNFKKGSKVYFKGNHYRIPLFRVGGRLYIKKFLLDLRALNWDSIKRQCLIPFIAILVGIKALNGRLDFKKKTTWP